eukprot:PITA_34708
MPDPGCVSGFIGVGIDRAIQQILDHINIAVRCRKEMASLKDLVMKIKPIVNEIQLYRAAINRKRKDKASAVNGWLKSLISEINEHVKLSPLVELAHISELLEEQTLKLQDDLEQIKEGIEALGSSSTSRGALPSISSANMTLIEEPLIVGQQKTFSILEKLVIDEVEANSIGVLGKGGSGKTLLLKTLFNSPKVRKHFSEGLFLWLTFSQSPCVTTLTNALRTQIATQQNVNLGEIMNGEEGKLWVNQTLRQSNRFVLFLDDVWGENAAELLEELGVTRPLRYHGNSKVIVCSRDRSALLKIGVADKYTITMEDLMEDESWKLFAYHAFPYNNGNLAANIDEEKAKLVCRKCAGLPLAIKVVGRALAGSTHSQQWEWALRSLPKANTLYDCLRLSYDALGKEGVHLQLCFLYLATIGIEDGIFHAQDAIQVWLAEGLLAKEIPKDEHELYDPFELGSFYVNLLADRCLIEAMITDFDGQVLYFRVHDLMRDLAILIAEEEENFHCRVGKGLTYLNENEFSSCIRLLLGHNKLCYFLPLTSCPQISTLSLTGNAYLTKFPGRVMKSMISLKLLSLSGTSVKSLSKTVGRLQQLVYLSLVDMPINKLPASLTNLINLEILVLSRSSITELPCDIYMLRSLRKLDIRGCKDLQYLPQSISRLTSLQRLETYGCPLLWNNCKYKGNKKYACINTLGSLTQLKRLQLENNGQTITMERWGR